VQIETVAVLLICVAVPTDDDGLDSGRRASTCERARHRCKTEIQRSSCRPLSLSLSLCCI